MIFLENTERIRWMELSLEEINDEMNYKNIPCSID